MIFKNKEELIERALDDDACYEGLKWAEAQPDLETILKTCKKDWRLWALERGYEQFAENCNWEELNSFDWRCLLLYQPQYIDKCNFRKLDVDDILYLLARSREVKKYLENL